MYSKQTGTMKLQYLALFFLCRGSISKQFDAKDVENDPTQCAPPSLPSEVRMHRNGEGNLIYYECESGFKTLGEVYATCENGQWSDPPPICIASRCPKTYTIEHGTVSLGYSGALLRFQCDPPHRLVGSSVLVCDGAEWNGTVPTCEDPYSRKALESPSRYSFYKTHEEWLMEADYSCIKAKDSVRPPAVDKAQPHTKWTFIEGKPRLYTLYRCVWGHVARGQSKHMYCQNGRWVGGLPKCIEAVSTPVPSIPRDESLQKRRSHDEWLEIADYTCMGTAEQPQRVSPEPVTNGDYQWRFARVDGTPRLYATLRCNHGYRVKVASDENIYCREGTWVGPDMQCVPTVDQDSGHGSCEVDNGGCAHLCRTVYGGPRCSCRAGYQLDTDGRSCRDIDECNFDNGGCEQICRNSDGGFKCHCLVGYELAENGKTCYEADGEIVAPLALMREG